MKGFPAQFTDLSGETFFATYLFFRKRPHKWSCNFENKWGRKIFWEFSRKHPHKRRPLFRVSEGRNIFVGNYEKYPAKWHPLFRVSRRVLLKNWGDFSNYFAKISKSSQLVSRKALKNFLQNPICYLPEKFPVD